jgi:hypothetical protein
MDMAVTSKAILFGGLFLVVSENNCAVDEIIFLFIYKNV